jgi:hypothetical protein
MSFLHYLSILGLAVGNKGKWYIKGSITDRQLCLPETRDLLENENKIKLIAAGLSILPLVTFTDLQRSILINFDPAMENRTWEVSDFSASPNLEQLLEFLRYRFPDLLLLYVSEQEAKNTKGFPIPEGQNACIKEGKVFIRKEIKLKEIAVEDMLHPFIEAIHQDNEDIFYTMYKEAKRNFPTLSKNIMEGKMNAHGFTKVDIKKQVVVAAFSMALLQQYEPSPTAGLLEVMNEFKSWFVDHLNYLRAYLNPSEPLINIDLLPTDFSLSEIL